jgi:hypothetical protein
MVDAAGESAAMVMVRSFSAAWGASCGLNSTVWLPMERPETSADVARAR